jgi:DNA-binding NarL/FixJ family response regulator
VKRLPRTRIVIADDHPLLRHGVVSLLQQERDFDVVGEAANGEEALMLSASLRPDILLLDLAMPPAGGLDVLRRLDRRKGDVRPIVFTAAIQQDEVVKVLRAGARGIVLKDAPSPVLLKSIRAVLDGRYWIGLEVLADIGRITEPAPPPAAPKNFGLTPRQLEVVAQVVAGRSNKEIATRLSVSEETVKHHLTHIFERLGISNRVELAVFGANHGLGRRA